MKYHIRKGTEYADVREGSEEAIILQIIQWQNYDINMPFSSNRCASRNYLIIMRYRLLFLLVITVLTSSRDSCSPFGLRLNYGRSVYDPKSDQQLALRFNTKQDCSGIQMKIANYSFPCYQRMVSHKLADYHKTRQLYTTYIHNCSIKQFQYEVKTNYSLYDRQGTPLLLESKTINIKNPHKKDQAFRFLHVADWGPITDPKNQQKEEPINASLVEMIRQGKADCLIINGDIGYELNTNALFHELTMEMIGEVASLTPLIINRGNHQENKKDNTVGTMFDDYFELYDLQISNATGITIGSLFLVLIDPANLLIPKNQFLFDEKTLYSSLDATKTYMEQGFSQGKTIVAFTHYPLICGYPSTKHCIADKEQGKQKPLYVNLIDFYRLVLKYRVPLVFSGHVHHYERSQRLLSDYKWNKSQQTEYAFDSEFFLQVVDGAGGSNDGLLKAAKKHYQWPGFVATHDEEKTGFGLLTANLTNLDYKHYRFPEEKGRQWFDNFAIKLPQKENIKNDL